MAPAEVPRGVGSEDMSERLVDALRRRDRARLAPYVLTLAVVALGYYVAGRIGLELA
jgi:hypothetical protein